MLFLHCRNKFAPRSYAKHYLSLPNGLALAFYLALLVCCSSFAQEKILPGHFNEPIERALNSNTDVLGQQVLLGGEPSFDSVAAFFPPMQRPREVVGVMESPDDFGISWDGEIQAARHVRISFRVGDPPSPYGIEGSITRTLLDGYLPIVETSWDYQGLRYKELVFGYSSGLNADEPSFAMIRLRVENVGEDEKKTTIHVYNLYGSNGPVPESTVLVPAKGFRDFHYRLPYNADLRQLVQTLTKAEFDQALQRTRDFWTKFLAQGMQIRTPEDRINNAYRAWLAYNFFNVDKINGIYEIHDGTGFYESVWGYSAAIYCNALSQYGYWDEAEKYLGSLLHSQHADGSVLFKAGMGFPDNGAVLFAIGDQYLLSRDLNWFKSVVPQTIRSAEWIASERAQTKQTKEGKNSITYGLLPAGQSGGDYSSPVYSYYSDVYNWLGLNEIAQAFRQAGMTSQADRWSTEAEDYRKDILASMEKSLVHVGSFEVLPVEPVTHRLMSNGGGDYYALFASMVLETGFFSSTDERSKWITQYMEQRGGLLLGMDRFQDGVDHAYSYGYALTQLQRGDVDKFLLTLYSMMAYGMSQDTYSAVEVTHIAQGLNEMTLPHTRSNTQQLRMLRMMLVREDSNNLLLASGSPRAWAASTKPVKVVGAPTKFGTVSFTLTSDLSAHRINAVIEPLKNNQGQFPDYVQVWLRAPKDWGRAAHVSINGREQTLESGDMVRFRGSDLNKQASVVAEFR